LAAWSRYFDLGQESWGRIIDSSWRRRVGLRFTRVVLQLDPGAYLTYQDRFLDVLIQSLVSACITIEHEYTSLLFSIDLLRDPLFANILCIRLPEDGDIDLTIPQFEALRIEILHSIFSAINQSLMSGKTNGYDVEIRKRNAIWTSLLVSMLDAMRDQYQPEGLTYAGFCGTVLDDLKTHYYIFQENRVHQALGWARTAKLVQM